MARERRSRLRWWLLGGLVVLAAVVFGGTWLYIHVIEGPAPAPLGLKSGPSSGHASASTTDSVAGTWRVASGSVVGYRVNEVLAGQNNVAVGRTSDITGSLTISRGTVRTATFSVPMDTIKSDQSGRDAQFNGRIMETSTYPTGTLTLTTPIALGALPAPGVIRTYHASADITLHGQTRRVTFRLAAERTATGIEVSGSIPILFADWDIGNPGFAGFVTTQDHGLLEFLIKFSRS
ncbi:MAG TPA: YceI family protein [Streptosporangiaceae bacterium]|nr:YceI family protein [Streptosporangiaceae bacterium]